MPNIENTLATIKNNDGKATVGQMQTTWFDQGDRLKRALQRLGFFWLLAGVTLFIPIAHFVLVPGFLIAGPVISYLTYQMCWMRDHINGYCPTCNEQITIKLESKDELPKWTYCPACNTPLHIIHPNNHPEN